ncbi:exopolysaccharide transport family protein [Pedobacter faecalis]|uniref:exopolysaccharide transport family protein n=1 Tax=Pedobacter faecalis TaxID=3041495 RepID=UPI00254ED6C9|nr:lipopolysaccharide biosynthesis protein [Pedobacter sp. ELA7]
MEEFRNFLRLLRSRILLLVMMPVIAIIITFFLVRNMPDSYSAQAQISTGIVDNSQQFILEATGGSNYMQVSQEFSNLIEMMRMKKILDMVSYQLIIHDLTHTDTYRSKSQAINETSTYNINRAIAVYRAKYAKREGLNLWDKDQNGMYRLLRSMRYDSESLKDKLRINRSGDSDFINIEFTSESSELSAFVVNTLATEFINYYSELVKTNQFKANTFLKALLAEKQETMNGRVSALRNYKIQNRVLNLDEQSSQLYQQILQYDQKIQQTIENIAAKSGALNEIDRKFDGRERGYLESTLTRVNQNLLSTKADLKSMYDVYIQNDFDPDYKRSIDSLQTILSEQINTSTDQFIYNPLVAKQDLVQKKLNLDIELDLARYSLGYMEKEQAKLNQQFDKLVPQEAEVQSMERDVDIASKEYLDILNKFNASSLEAGLDIKLKFVQPAMPGLPQASKKMLLVILSGIITFVFCLFILFILFFLDDSVRTPKQLANATKRPVLGVLKGTFNDISKLWEGRETNKGLTEFKDQLRSIRFEIDKLVSGKMLAITSLNESEGKSLLSLSLAYAWVMTKKRILIIDGNFTNPNISNVIREPVYLEDFFTGSASIDIPIKSNITVLCNKGGDKSLYEVADKASIHKALYSLYDHFDLIIVDTASLKALNKSAEWFEFCDHVIAVYEGGKPIGDDRKQYITYLHNLDNKFIGWVLNNSKRVS